MKYRIVIALLVVAIVALSVGLYRSIFPANEEKDMLVLYGNVDVRQVDIGFRVPGQVATLVYEEGDKVDPGKVMAVLDKTPYDSQVKQARANMDAIKVNLENAEVLLKRRLDLIGVGGVSQEDLDNSRTSRDQLRANLAQAEAALAVALDNLAYTDVSAPTEGIILTRIREPGTVVNPGDPVYTLSVSSPVWIRAFVDEPHLGKVYYGMPAEIYTDSDGGKVYTGQVGFISPVSEFTPKTVETTQLRTDLVYRLRIYADNPDHGLVQGMPVTVKLKLKNE
jgi:HlyD family secretion protein